MAAAGAPPLAGLRVLVTRPAHQSATFCGLLEGAGATPLRLPVIAIEAPADGRAARAQISDLSGVDLAIFVSANAVEFSHRLRPMPWPELAAAQIAAIGRATAVALEAHGMPAGVVPTTGFDSDALLDMPQLTDVQHKTAIIFRGKGGRERLRDKLTARGARVIYAETYRRLRPVIDAEWLAQALAAGTIDALTASSDAGLDNLHSLTPEVSRAALLALPLVVNSERNLRRARALGFNSNVLVPPHPGDRGQLAALIDWHRNRHRQQ